MVLIDASTSWSYVCLLSIRNVVFAKLFAQIIWLKTQFPDHPIKIIHLDNADEFSSHTFLDYCTSISINVKHPFVYTHTQNKLPESLIKRLQLIVRPLLLRTKLSLSAWRHAILHVATLIWILPTANHEFSHLQLALSSQPNVSHLLIFGCAIYVPIAPPQRSKLGHQHWLGIYVDFNSPFIIHYLEPLTTDVFIARFIYCYFDENVIPSLRESKSIP